jgi:hypothetical protein
MAQTGGGVNRGGGTKPKKAVWEATEVKKKKPRGGKTAGKAGGARGATSAAEDKARAKRIADKLAALRAAKN